MQIIDLSVLIAYQLDLNKLQIKSKKSIKKSLLKREAPRTPLFDKRQLRLLYHLLELFCPLVIHVPQDQRCTTEDENEFSW
jgi:hypothetical protein